MARRHAPTVRLGCASVARKRPADQRRRPAPAPAAAARPATGAAAKPAPADPRPALKVLAGLGARRRRLPSSPAILGGGPTGELDPAARPRSGRARPGDDDRDDRRQPAETEAAEELGYPAFATNNTTRVGGADPAANAAGVALAVFPSDRPDQRADAVTLVDEDDWQGAIAAAVLMAEPVRAPILISAADGVPDATAAGARRARPAGPSRRTVPRPSRSATPTSPAACRRRGSTAAARPRSRRRSPPARQARRRPPQHIVIAPAAEPGLRDAGRRLGRALGRPGPLRGAGTLPAADRRRR